MGREQRRVLYSGDVQGVGFRFTALRVGRGYDVDGTVMNLPDGRVELVVEGSAPSLDVYLQDLAEAMSGYITETEVETSQATGEFSGLQVRY